MSVKRRIFACGFLFVVFCAAPVAPALQSTNPFSIGGNVRFLATHSSYTELKPLFPDSQTFLRSSFRLTIAGRPAPAVGYDIHVVPYIDYDSEPESGLFKPRIGNPRYHVGPPLRTWSRGSWGAGLRLDRFNIRISLPGADLTVGRQAVTFGHAFFWNPLDVFAPFRLLDFDREYKEGVDAVRLDVPTGRFSGLNLIAAPGREIVFSPDFRETSARGGVSRYGSALLARYSTIYQGWEMSFQAGKVYGGFQLGAGAAGEAGSFDMRMEAAYFIADKARRRPLPDPLANDLLEDHVTAVLGFSWRFPYELDFAVEYFYNGAARAKYIESALLRVVHGSNLQMSTQLLGAVFRYPVLPIVSARLAWILSIPDHSFLVHPHVTLSLTDEMDLYLGGTWGFGDGPFLYQQQYPLLRSEFGTYPNALYLLLKVYF